MFITLLSGLIGISDFIFREYIFMSGTSYYGYSCLFEIHCPSFESSISWSNFDPTIKPDSNKSHHNNIKSKF